MFFLHVSSCSVRYPPFTTRNLKIASSLIVPKIKRRSYFRKAVMLCFIAVMVAFGLRVKLFIVCNVWAVYVHMCVHIA